jgi:hypothetical protein
LIVSIRKGQIPTHKSRSAFDVMTVGYLRLTRHSLHLIEKQFAASLALLASVITVGKASLTGYGAGHLQDG